MKKKNPEFIEVQRALIEDLIKAVKYAAWLDTEGKPNLRTPTFHMADAINNLENVLYKKCPTCYQILPEE